MPATRIFEAGYCYKAEVLEKRHRNPTEFLLRGSMPIGVAAVTKDEAPVRLRATIRIPEWPNAGGGTELRHDGHSYLRAIDHPPKTAGAQPTPFTADDFADMLAWRGSPWAAVYGDQDKPDGFLTTANSALREWRQATRIMRDPDSLPRSTDIGANAREWRHSGEATAVKAATEEAAALVLVDGHLHRRVGVPVVVLHGGIPTIKHSDQYAVALRQAKANGGIIEHPGGDWMPIAYLAEVPALAAAAGKDSAAWTCEVEAPLETDERRNLGFALAAAARQCRPYLAAAVHDLSADGMAAWRGFRENFPAATRGDPDADAGLALLAAMRTMAEDRAHADVAATLAMRQQVGPTLEFLDAMARRSGLVMDAADERALAQLSA